MPRITPSSLLRAATAALPLLLMAGQGCRAEAQHEAAPAPLAQPRKADALAEAPESAAATAGKVEQAIDEAERPAAVWLPDGHRAALLRAGQVEVTDAASGAQRRFRGSRGEASAFAVALRAELIALGAGDRIEVFDLGSGAQRATIERGWSGEAQALTLSPDASLAAAFWGGKVRVWEVSSGKPLSAVALDAELLGTLRLTDDQQLVNSNEGQLMVWQATTGKKLLEREIPGVADLCDAAPPALSGDGRWLAVTADMKTVHIWGTLPMREVAVVTVSDDDDASLITSRLEFTSDDRHLLVTEHERRWQKAIAARSWRLVDAPCADAQLKEAPSTPSPDGRWLLDERRGEARVRRRAEPR